MPALPPFNPSVSVFHLNSKVSNAKIRKYKLATERGMVGSPKVKTHSNGTNHLTKTKSVPAKPKQSRLKLNVRQQDEVSEGEVIHVRRAPVGPKKRHYDEAFPKDQRREKRSSPGAESSSGLSSADSNISSPRSAINGAEQASDASTAAKDCDNDAHSRLFSYYVQADEPDTEQERIEHKQRATKMQRASKAAPRRRSSTAKQRTIAAEHQYTPVQQATKHAHEAVTAHQQPQHQNVQAPALEHFRIGPPDPVPIMIEKLDALSQALIDFGGVPPTSPSPKSTSVDNYTRNGPRFSHSTSQQDDKIPMIAGQHDAALTYGIQFIINALKSWAFSRLHHLHQQAAAMHGHHRPALPLTLAGTPEGRAIAAFRSVVESGCLRVTAIIPVALSQALRRLYLQIDHLINQGVKQEPPWRCLSYRAQIEANRVRVKSAMEERAKAEREMVTQHQLAHQQMMRQMGLPAHFTSTMFYQQPQDPSDASADSRRYNQNLIRLPVQALEQPTATQGMHHIANSGYSMAPTSGAPMSLLIADRQRLLAKQDATTSALLPRSGQSMQFSFTPSSNVALQAFGVSSFPADRDTPPGPPHGSNQLAASLASAVNARVAQDEEIANRRGGFVAINAQHT